MTWRALPLMATALALSTAACENMNQQQAAAPPPPQAAAYQQKQVVSTDLTRNIQMSLNQQGYNVGPVDGHFGASTRDALARFQVAKGLPSTGQVNQPTLAALGIQGAQNVAIPSGSMGSQYTPVSRRKTSMAQPSPQVRQMQSELKSRGYNVGAVDGVWGPHTRQALIQFQKDHNMAATGRPDQQTLAALAAPSGQPQTGQLPANR